MREIVINVCFGGFGLSDEAYELLIKYGIPVKRYIKEVRDKNGRYKPQPKNEGEIIFDRKLTLKGENSLSDHYYKYPSIMSRYWETWLDQKRDYPLLIKIVKKLKKKANGNHAKLKIVKIPNNVEYTIEEYDGFEHIAENHRTWE